MFIYTVWLNYNYGSCVFDFWVLGCDGSFMFVFVWCLYFKILENKLILFVWMDVVVCVYEFNFLWFYLLCCLFGLKYARSWKKFELGWFFKFLGFGEIWAVQMLNWSNLIWLLGKKLLGLSYSCVNWLVWWLWKIGLIASCGKVRKEF